MSVIAPSAIRRHLVALRVLLMLTVVVGIAYPLVILGIGQVAFAHQANGSTVDHRGSVVGSSLIGQNMTDAKGRPLPAWFQSRPSAAGEHGYDPTASGASNLGPYSPELVRDITSRRRAVAEFDSVPGHQVTPADVPPDAVTASGSGLDPQISPTYARQQVARVARARNLTTGKVEQLLIEHTQGRTLGFLGEPRVNVLELNLALSRLR